jgi:hypothetical protein
VPDRVPVSTYELCGYNSRAWENNDDSYAPLMAFIRENTDCLCMWEPPCNALFLESANQADMDVESVRMDDALITTRVLHTPKGDLRHVSKVYDNVHTVWTLEHWCKSVEDVDKAMSVPFEPLTYDYADLPRLQGELGGHGVVMDSLSDPLWMAADLMEFGQYTLWALTEPEHFLKTLRTMHERCMENLRGRLATPVDVYRICGPEYACPPYLPPSFFEMFVTPYVKEMTDLIHSHGALVRFHCHGKIGAVLDSILATGADAIDPCEPPPDGDVPLAELKRSIGKHMCLCGNLELKLLEQGSPEEVARTVKESMIAAKSGGGFIMLPTASPINSPLAAKTTQNYMTFIKTAIECGRY